MITDNTLLLHLKISYFTVCKGKLEERQYTSYTAYLHKGTNRHRPKVLSEVNILYCASQEKWLHCALCLQEKIKKPPIEKALYFVYNHIHKGTRVGRETLKN